MRATVKITIHPEVKKILILLCTAAVLGIAILAALPLLQKSFSGPDAGSSSDARAAVDAVAAFYTLDYGADHDLWATRVCMHTTQAGCRAIRGFFAPAVEAMIVKNQVRTSCTVTPVRMVSDEGAIRVWQVSVTINQPWAGLDDPVQDVFVEMEQVNGFWLMNRILFQQETNTDPTLIP